MKATYKSFVWHFCNYVHFSYITNTLLETRHHAQKCKNKTKEWSQEGEEIEWKRQNIKIFLLANVKYQQGHTISGPPDSGSNEVGAKQQMVVQQIRNCYQMPVWRALLGITDLGVEQKPVGRDIKV